MPICWLRSLVRLPWKMCAVSTQHECNTIKDKGFLYIVMFQIIIIAQLNLCIDSPYVDILFPLSAWFGELHDVTAWRPKAPVCWFWALVHSSVSINQETWVAEMETAVYFLLLVYEMGLKKLCIHANILVQIYNFVHCSCWSSLIRSLLFSGIG